jgi:2-haloacid dehalogenase
MLSGDYKMLTFDCYGTLIDWDSGIRGALQSLIDSSGVSVGAEEVYAAYIETEAGLERAPYLRYAEILQRVVVELGARFGFAVDESGRRALVDSLPHWQPFDDTNAALIRLRSRYQLGILSNIDRDLNARTREHFDVAFDQVVTAEDVGSYKPAHGHFERILAETGYDKSEILHVAQSVFHDIVPATALGFTSVWINRRGERNESGVVPNAEFPDLKSLADALGV